MQRKHYIIVAVILVIVSFACMFTGFVMGNTTVTDCPECTDCPEVVEAGECPACPDCPECEECEQTVVEKEVEVTRVVTITEEVMVIVTATPQIPVVQFKGPGMFLVGTDIEEGTYKIEGECYWERLECLEGTFSCIISNGNVEGQGYVTILEKDIAFNTTRSCNFTKIE
jgi:hypothetical protein